MKKYFMALVAVTMLTVGANAQDDAKNGQRPKRMDKTEMVKHRTDGMVKKYGLSDEQAAQLLQLNTTFADKMGPGMGGPRRGKAGGPGRMEIDRPGDDNRKAPDLSKDRKPRNEDVQEKDGKGLKNDERMAQMRQTMKEYEDELQKIMTDEQFEQYKTDQKQRPRPLQHGRRDANVKE